MKSDIVVAYLYTFSRIPLKSIRLNKKTSEMDLELIKLESLISLSIRLTIDLIIAGVLIFGIYTPSANKRAFIFTLILFNLIIFSMGNLLNNTYLSMGSGLGLFAIFTMLRYRSETLSLKEMTYLFILIAIGFINAVGQSISILEIVLLNSAVVAITYYLERSGSCRSHETKKIKYDNLNLIRPENRERLLYDIFTKTGIRAVDAIVESVNFSDRTASITLICREEHSPVRNGKRASGKNIRSLNRTSIRLDPSGGKIRRIQNVKK